MGVTEDLNLNENNFSNAASAFWIAVVLAEVPSSAQIQNQANHETNADIAFSLLSPENASWQMALNMPIWLVSGNCLYCSNDELQGAASLQNLRRHIRVGYTSVPNAY